MGTNMEQVKKAFYEAVQKLEQELGCQIHARDEGNTLYMIISCNDFVKSLINKVKQSVSPKVLKMLEIDGTAVQNFMVIRIRVIQNG